MDVRGYNDVFWQVSTNDDAFAIAEFRYFHLENSVVDDYYWDITALSEKNDIHF